VAVAVACAWLVAAGTKADFREIHSFGMCWVVAPVPESLTPTGLPRCWLF